MSLRAIVNSKLGVMSPDAIFWARKAADQGLADAKPLIQSLAIAQFSQGSLRRQAAAQMAKEALRAAKAGVTP